MQKVPYSGVNNGMTYALEFSQSQHREKLAVTLQSGGPWAMWLRQWPSQSLDPCWIGVSVQPISRGQAAGQAELRG